LSERYGEERVEAACERALAIRSPTYKTVKSILKNGLDKVKRAEEGEAKTVVHENIRGGAYFDREEGEQAKRIDEIEARYLDEERLAIILFLPKVCAVRKDFSASARNCNENRRHPSAPILVFSGLSTHDSRLTTARLRLLSAAHCSHDLSVAAEPRYE